MRYKTADLAKLLGVTTNTIRRYEKNGYTMPVRDESNYRWFRENDIFKIAIIRLYRRCGFSHDEIENMLDGSFDSVLEIFENRLTETEKEIERLNLMRAWLSDNIDEIKDFENLKGFSISCCEEYKYVVFSDGTTFLRENERLEIINRFMYELPTVHMAQFWSLEDILKGEFRVPPTGWAVKAKDFEGFEIDDRLKKYISVYPVRKCLVGIMKKHPKNFDAKGRHILVAEEYFKDALAYMEEKGLKPIGDPIGVVENSLAETAWQKIYMPIK